MCSSCNPRSCSGSAGRTAFGLQEVWSGAMCPSTWLTRSCMASSSLFEEDQLISSDLVALTSSIGRLLRLWELFISHRMASLQCLQQKRHIITKYSSENEERLHISAQGVAKKPKRTPRTQSWVCYNLFVLSKFEFLSRTLFAESSPRHLCCRHEPVLQRRNWLHNCLSKCLSVTKANWTLR